MFSTNTMGRAVLFGLSLATCQIAQAALINGGFEQPADTPGTANYSIVDASTIPGWKTTASDNKIEIWSDAYQGVVAYEGSQFAELNAFQVSTLYQDVTGIATGGVVGFEFAHRGRSGVDTLRLSIIDLGLDSLLGGGDDTTLFTGQYATGNTAWAFYTSAAEAPILALGNSVRFAYESVSAAGGNPAIGNFLDAANFGVGVGVSTVPEPSSIALLLLGMMGLAVRGRAPWRGQA